MSDDLVKRLNQTLGGISSPPVLDGDNLSILLCSAFEDDGEQNENGWTDAAVEGCEQTLQAIRNHYAPLADRIEELEADLRKMALDYLAAEGQAAEAYQAQLEAEAKLSRAVEGLQHYACDCVISCEQLNGSCGDMARTALAELKGEDRG
jgi:hypothetical protein